MLNDPYTSEPTIDGPRSVTFAIRSNRAGNEIFLNQVQQAVWSVNASLPLASITTLQEVYGQSMARTSFTLVMLAIAGSMALVLGIVLRNSIVPADAGPQLRELNRRELVDQAPPRFVAIRHFAVRVEELVRDLQVIAARIFV